MQWRGIFVAKAFIPLCELSHFSTSMYRQWVPCERNSSYYFIPIFLKLCPCFLHGLKMCMWFGYNPRVNFCPFFHSVNFVIFWPQILWKCIDSGYLVSANPHTILYWSFWNFARFLHGLEMFMWFGYNPWSNCCHFFHFVNIVIFWPRILWKYIDSGYLVSATPYTISILSSCNFAHLFFHGLKMCIWFGFNPADNFCHFSTLLTLSFFNFSQVRPTSPKLDLYFSLKINLVSSIIKSMLADLNQKLAS